MVKIGSSDSGRRDGGEQANDTSLVPRLPFLDRCVLSMVAGTAVVAWLALALAQASRLGLVLLAAGSAALLVALYRVPGAARSATKTHVATSHGPDDGLPDVATIAALVLVAMALLAPTMETTLWAGDATIYLSTGRQVGRSGAWLFRDELVDDVPADERAEVFGNRLDRDMTGALARFPGGLAISSVDDARVAAGFSPLFPILLAVGFQLSGSLEGMLLVPSVFAVLSVCVVFLIGRLVGGRLVGTFAALLLMACMPQVWFSRLATSEVVTQFYVLGGLLALMHGVRLESRREAWIAGLAFAAAGLASFDVLPVLIWALTVFIASALIARRSVSPAMWTLALLCVASFHAAYHFAVFPSNYRRFVSIRLDPDWIIGGLQRSFGAGSISLLLALIVLLASVAVAVSRKGRPGARLSGLQVCGVALFSAALFGAIAYLLVVPPMERFTVAWLAWYLSWPAVAVLPIAAIDRGMLGWRHPGDPAIVLLLSLALAATAFQLHNPQEQEFGMQLWTVRRFVPMVFPLAVLLIVSGLARASRRILGTDLAAAVVLSALVALAARPTVALVGQEFWRDGVAQSRNIAQAFPGDAVVLVGHDLAGTHVQATLSYLFDVDALLLQSRHPDPTVWGRQLTRWRDAGRRVFLMTSAADTHLAMPALSLEAYARRRARIPMLESAVGRVPHRVVDRDLALNVYELQDEGPDGTTEVDIGTYSSDGCFYLEGLHGPETDRALQESFRWTSAHATILVPAARAYKIRVGGARPAGLPPTRLEVFLNGSRVELAELPSDPVEISVDNPSAERAGTARLELRSRTFNPRALGVSEDSRDLGVRLYGIAWGRGGE